MGRKTKTGLDYFSFDVDFFIDEKIEFVAAKFGSMGELIVIKLLCRIYREGYFTKWGDDECLLFSKRFSSDVSQELIDGVIGELLHRDFFCKKLYKKYSILTSNGIQSRFFEAAKRRKIINVYIEYLIVNINEIDVNINAINVDRSTQSKVKERKVKEIEVADFNIFYKAYPKKKSKPQAEKTWKKLSPTNDLLKIILTGLEAAKNSDDWAKDNGKYIPHPSTWLNNKGWEDELIEARDCEIIVDGVSEMVTLTEFKEYRVANGR